MNTELIDYIKTLTKREFFYVSLADLVFSTVIIVCGIISLNTGATTLLYTIMFASATALLGFNSYKGFKKGSKNGWVFAVIGLGFMFITGVCMWALIGGI